MKKIILAFGLILSGCAHYIPYHSTANNSRYTTSIATSMHLIPEDVNAHSQHGFFGVIAAIDDSMEHPSYYIILAPCTGVYPTSINDVDLAHTATVTPSEASDIIHHLSDMVNEWDAPTVDSDGKFYEFTTHTEMPIPGNNMLIAMRHMLLESSSPNEEGWVPSLDLTYNRTSRGSDMTVQIGTPNYSFRYEITNKEQVQSFQQQMERALEYLKGRGMR